MCLFCPHWLAGGHEGGHGLPDDDDDDVTEKRILIVSETIIKHFVFKMFRTSLEMVSMWDG